jgi:hypothetical protein
MSGRNASGAPQCSAVDWYGACVSGREREVLFGPLTGLEVVDTDVEGFVVMVKAKMIVNLKALTLEQQTERRRMIVRNMAEQMQMSATLKLEQSTNAWGVVSKLNGGEAAAKVFIKTFKLAAAHKAEYYNVDEQLGRYMRRQTQRVCADTPPLLLTHCAPCVASSVMESVALSKILEGWPAGLQALMSREKKESVADLVPGDDGAFRLATKGPLTEVEVHGVIALAWIAVRLTALDLNGRTILPEYLVMVARALPKNLQSLSLSMCDVAKQGQDIKGIEQLGLALGSSQCMLQVLDLTKNVLKPDAASCIAKGLCANTSLRSLRCAPLGSGRRALASTHPQAFMCVPSCLRPLLPTLEPSRHCLHLARCYTSRTPHVAEPECWRAEVCTIPMCEEPDSSCENVRSP